jgi:heme oxygenase
VARSVRRLPTCGLIDTHPTPRDLAPVTTTGVETLSQRLRVETKDLHVAAERSGIMRSVLRGTLDRASYVRMLRSLGVIYRRLEGLLATTAFAPAAGFHRPELARVASLTRDEHVVAGGDPRLALLPAAPTAIAYDARLVDVGRDAPHRLVAHAYVRYLGDLSGGQMIEPLIRKAIALPEGKGTDFYHFAGIPDANACKATLRGILDVIPARSPEGDDIVDEARWSFRAHATLFEELAPVATSPGPT